MQYLIDISCFFTGDKEVVAAMKEFGDYTDQARLVYSCAQVLVKTTCTGYR